MGFQFLSSLASQKFQLLSSLLQTGCGWILFLLNINLAPNAVQECEYEIQNCYAGKGQVLLKYQGRSKLVMFAYSINSPSSLFIKSVLLLLFLLHGCWLWCQECASHKENHEDRSRWRQRGRGGLCPQHQPHVTGELGQMPGKGMRKVEDAKNLASIGRRLRSTDLLGQELADSQYRRNSG